MNVDEYMAQLDVFEVDHGWDTLHGYVMVKGHIRVGIREAADHLPAAWQQRVCAQAAAGEWEVITLGDAVPKTPEGDGFDWPTLIPLTETMGVAPQLIDVVDELHPVGEWRWGTYPGCRFKVGKDAHMLVKVVAGEVVALVAPCLLEGEVGSERDSEEPEPRCCAGCGDVDPAHWREGGWYCDGCAFCEVCQSPYCDEPEHRV